MRLVIFLTLFLAVQSVGAVEGLYPLEQRTWKSTSPKELSFLDSAVQDARIVFVGEAAHFIHEKYDYNKMMIQYLVSRGFTHFGNEMGRSDGKMIDRFIQTGDTQFFDQVGLYGYRDEYIRPRQLSEAKPQSKREVNQFRRAFRNEERQRYQFIRNEGLRAKRPVSYFGYDLDMNPGGTYRELIQILAYRSGEADVDLLIQRLDQLGREPRLQSEIDGLNEIQNTVEQGDLRNRLGRLHFEEFDEAISNLIESLVLEKGYLELTDENAYAQLYSIFERREKSMIKFMERFLRRNPTAKVALFGHDAHLSKTDQMLFGTIDEPGVRPYWPSIGGFLTQKLGRKKIVGIWQLHETGTESVTQPIIPGLWFKWVSEAPGFAGERLSELGKVFFLDTQRARRKETWLGEMTNMSSNQGAQAAVLSEAADFLFFVKRVSKLQVGREPNRD